MSAEELMAQSGFTSEDDLMNLVEGDRANVAGEEAGGASPAIWSAVTAVGALLTTSGLCPTWGCTYSCRR